MTRNRYGSVPGASNIDDDERDSDDSDSPLADQNNVESFIANQKWKLKVTKVVKFLAYPIVFGLVLCSSVIAKGTVLFMTSQIRSNKTALHCIRKQHSDKTFVVTIPEVEKVAWIWCIIFAFTVPELLTFIRSSITCLFQFTKLPKPEHILLVLVMETFHVIGLAIMFTQILPELDIIQGAMLTNCLCFVPGLLGLLSRNKARDGSKRFLLIFMDILALAAQTVGFAMWPLFDISNPVLWLLPVALFLVSCGWWENFVSLNSPLFFIRSLARIREDINLTRNYTYLFVSLWKIAIFFFSNVVILHVKNNTGFYYLFRDFKPAFHNHNITVTEVYAQIGGGTVPDLTDVLPNSVTIMMHTEFTVPIYVLITQIVSAYFAYVCGKFACKILIQGFGFALPITLTIPVLVSLLIITSILRSGDPCIFQGVIPDYLFLKSPSFSVLDDFIFQEDLWFWLMWFLSQTWIILHIYTPKCERPESTEKLFVTPYYNGLLIDQSMGLNRKKDDDVCSYEDSKKRLKNENDHEARSEESCRPKSRKNDVVTKIYACATMWHETEKEMTEFLKSILRLDRHQCAMRNYQEALTIANPDFYKLETHIFFDDSFKKSKELKNEVEVNDWVKQLIKVIHETSFSESKIPIKPPKKFPTPYGGRLVWTLPGNTKMFVHLKDSNKIRHRKRWSQVMYMHYLLRHKISNLSISKERKRAIEENTFLLALDGDIVFQPSAIKLLVDLMKEHKNLGAACGRIHPVGSGPMVWFQKFEYAIGHWLQKATEHMIGCVLCSPGCFSLFRAKALTKVDVMKTYSKTSTEALHYVQYDQGEDRWLCTLLLKRGYRVEYSAASDAWTHAPDGFNEFFKQRRRWLPSTMANIMDLLLDYRRVVEKNNNISKLYVLYQLILMVGTILGPGTIYLMLVGASVTAFDIDIWTSFYLNLFPVLLFVVICLICCSDTQLLFAAIISMIYSVVMMAVLIGIFHQIVQDSWLAPSSIFLLLVIAQIVISGIMHPQELDCVPCGVIYYLSIPSMYLFLQIYSIANLNDITWGTRVTDADEKADERSEQVEEPPNSSKTKPDSFISFDKNDQGAMEFSLAGLIKCIFCTLKKPSNEEHNLGLIAKSLESFDKRLQTLERPSRTEEVKGSTNLMNNSPGNDEVDHADSDSESSLSQNTDGNPDRAFLVNPYWLEDEKLKNGEVDFLTAREEHFWKSIIKTHLFPIDENKKEQDSLTVDLKKLRDKYFIIFFMMNVLFVTIVFLMQLNQDLLHIEWPLSSKTMISFRTNLNEVHIRKIYLQLEPLGLVFVSFFGFILVIQFTAMLFHRLNTFTHILASTTLQGLGYCWKKTGNLSRKAFLVEIAEEMVEELERSTDIIDVDRRMDASASSNNGPRRSTGNRTLDTLFRRKIITMSEGSGLPRHMSARKSIQVYRALQENQGISDQRRSSQAQSQIIGGNNSTGNNPPALGQPGPSTRNLDTVVEVSEGHGSHFNFAFEIAESSNIEESRG